MILPFLLLATCRALTIPLDVAEPRQVALSREIEGRSIWFLDDGNLVGYSERVTAFLHPSPDLPPLFRSARMRRKLGRCRRKDFKIVPSGHIVLGFACGNINIQAFISVNNNLIEYFYYYPVTHTPWIVHSVGDGTFLIADDNVLKRYSWDGRLLWSAPLFYDEITVASLYSAHDTILAWGNRGHIRWYSWKDGRVVARLYLKKFAHLHRGDGEYSVAWTAHQDNTSELLVISETKHTLVRSVTVPMRITDLEETTTGLFVVLGLVQQNQSAWWRLVAIDPADGRESWCINFKPKGERSPSLTATRQGHILVSPHDRLLVALDATGRVVWKWTPPPKMRIDGRETMVFPTQKRIIVPVAREDIPASYYAILALPDSGGESP